MRNHTQTIFFLSSIIGSFLQTACASVDDTNECGALGTEQDHDADSDTLGDSDEGSLEAVYLAAIEDAVFADSDEIADDLIAVTTDDDRVIWMQGGDEARVSVVTWTSYPDSFIQGETVTNDWGDLWVTISPELKERMRDFNDKNSLRIAQLLGMPPDTTNSHFATLWVRPDDMFRPAPDNEIIDHTCELLLPANADAQYVDWYDNNILSSYFPSAYPWTRLGYTYDWAPGADEQGLSEFVVKQGSSLIVESIKTNDEYLRD
jgi:hypothetical protein